MLVSLLLIPMAAAPQICGLRVGISVVLQTAVDSVQQASGAEAKHGMGARCLTTIDKRSTGPLWFVWKACDSLIINSCTTLSEGEL